MKYSLFYNRKVVGDVLMIVINPILKMTGYKKDEDIVTIYHDDEIIGYNIFNISRIIKIHHEGLIVSPFKPLIDVINNMLTNHQLPILDEDDSSSFIVGKVVGVKNNIYKVDIKDKIVEVKSNFNLSIDDIVIYVNANTMLPNGKYILNGVIASKAMLMLEDKDEPLILDDENLLGKDFYSGEVKWSN